MPPLTLNLLGHMEILVSYPYWTRKSLSSIPTEPQAELIDLYLWTSLIPKLQLWVIQFIIRYARAEIKDRSCQRREQRISCPINDDVIWAIYDEPRDYFMSALHVSSIHIYGNWINSSRRIDLRGRQYFPCYCFVFVARIMLGAPKAATITLLANPTKVVWIWR